MAFKSLQVHFLMWNCVLCAVAGGTAQFLKCLQRKKKKKNEQMLNKGTDVVVMWRKQWKARKKKWDWETNLEYLGDTPER